MLQGWERMLGSAQSPGGSFWAQLARFQDAVSPHFLHRFPAAPHPLDLTSGGVSCLVFLAEVAVEGSGARAGLLSAAATLRSQDAGAAPAH